MAINVLYVEDEPSLAQIVSESLQTRGYHVSVANDGKESLSLMDRGVYDICVLDIMLPKIDGYSVAKELLEKMPNLPIIFLTAKVQTKDVVKGFESGGRYYIRKPFSMEELIARIENLVNHEENEPGIPECYDFGKFRLYPNRFELKYGYQTIFLSERESRILHLLCRHMNQSCDRRLILKEIWGDDSYYNSRNLDVYINKLRKILSVDKGVEIVTLKGVGYVFKVK